MKSWCLQRGPGRGELPLSLGWRRGLQASVHTAVGCVLTRTTQEADRPEGVALISSDWRPCEDRDTRSSPAHSKGHAGTRQEAGPWPAKGEAPDHDDLRLPTSRTLSKTTRGGVCLSWQLSQTCRPSPLLLSRPRLPPAQCPAPPGCARGLPAPGPSPAQSCCPPAASSIAKSPCRPSMPRFYPRQTALGAGDLSSRGSRTSQPTR